MPATVSFYLLKAFPIFITIYYIWKSKETKFWICYSLNRTVCNCTRCHHSVRYLVMRLLANLSSHNGDIQTLRNNAVLARNGLLVPLTITFLLFEDNTFKIQWRSFLLDPRLTEGPVKSPLFVSLAFFSGMGSRFFARW